MLLCRILCHQFKRKKMNTGSNKIKVLVTGGTGFVASHCILQLLGQGYQVRTTLCKLSRTDEVQAMMRQGGLADLSQLEFAAADLNKDAGWAEAVAGCDNVLHIASPIGHETPKDENEMIRPAKPAQFPPDCLRTANMRSVSFRRRALWTKHCAC